MDFSVIQKYFGNDLNETIISQLKALGDLYADWNSKINVVSRKDIDNLYLHHVLHSLAIAKFLGPLLDGSTLLDMGTGGGFPGVPLAIVYPNCKFHLIDRIAKKIRVATEISAAVGLNNVTFQHGDIGECHQKYDYVVSRAVMRLDALVPLIRKNVSPDSKNTYLNGLVCLKGGDIEDESRSVNYPIAEYPINEFFAEQFFETKKLVYVPMVKKNNK
jgi:16S rRNA (guanine527-N7)-methyltransferase